MRKIVFLIDTYPPGKGGMETHAFEFAHFLETQDVFDFKGVIAFGSPEDARVADPNIFPIIPYILPRTALDDATHLRKLLTTLAIGEGDIIFFNSLYWIRVLPTLRSLFPRTYFYQRSGGNDMVQAPILEEGATLNDRRTYICTTLNSGLSGLIVTSQYSLERLNRMGLKKRMMKAVVGGVDLERFHAVSIEKKNALRKKFGLPREATLILDVARLVPFKGIEYTVRALAELAQRMPESESFIYLVIGSGPELPRLEEVVNALNLQERVYFIGDVAHGSIHEYYQAADIFCHSAIRYRQTVRGGSYIHTESMGRCLMEALASGLPIVSSDVGGIKEVLHDSRTGILVSSRDPNAIASGLHTLASQPQLRQKMALAGRTVAEESLSWKKVFDTYLSLFEDEYNEP